MSREQPGDFRKFRRGRRWEAGDVNVLLERDWRTVFSNLGAA